MLKSIDQDVSNFLRSNGEIFTFAKIGQGVVDIRDFQTTGVVAFARRCPFYMLASGKLEVMGSASRSTSRSGSLPSTRSTS